MRRTIALVADALVLALALAVLAIIVTGGGVFFAGGQRISATGVDNPLLILSLLATLRYVLLRRVPVFGVERWSVASLEDQARTTVTRFLRYIEALPARAAILTVALTVAVATVIKLLLAWVYPGFFSGDDVEVHEMSVGVLWHGESRRMTGSFSHTRRRAQHGSTLPLP